MDLPGSRRSRSGLMAGSQTPHWRNRFGSYIYTVEEAARGLYPGNR